MSPQMQVRPKQLAPGISSASFASDAFRQNHLINPGFEQWLRGNGPFTASGVMSADRWFPSIYPADSFSISKDTTNQDAGSATCAAVTFTLNGGGARSSFAQAIEGNTNYQGRTLSFSIRAKTTVANSLRAVLWDGTVWWYSSYHSGNGTYQTLTTTATILTNATAVYAGVLPALSGTYYLDNACLVTGPMALDFVPLVTVEDIQRCLRYYESVISTTIGSDGVEILFGNATAANVAIYLTRLFRSMKPITPTVTKVGTWSASNMGQPSADLISKDGFRFLGSASAAGLAYTYTNGVSGAGWTAEANP